MAFKIAIANGTPFYRQGKRAWLPPDEWVSLKQWIEFLDDTILLKPEIVSKRPPEGWVEMPSEVDIHRLCYHKDGYFNRRNATLKAANDLLRHCDILYARMPNYEAYWCYQVAKKKGIPLLLEIHGNWETSILEEDSQGIFRRATRLYRACVARQAVLKMAKTAFCVLTIGPQLSKEYVPESTPSLVSTNHLLNERYYCRRENFTLKNPPRIFFAGNIQRRKGLHVLFQSLSIINESGRHFEMLLAGSGPMVKELKAYASRKGFAESVRFVGQVAHGEELFEYYRTADIFVLPSVAAEGVPRVTHEAMALGCPVIATDIGSIAWQLSDGTGVVVAPRDAKTLAKAIVEVLDNVELRRSLSEKGYRRSMEYTLEKQKAGIAEFVTTHLNRRRPTKGF